MLNWEDKMKEEEEKHRSAFEQQRQALLAKKLEEQKQQLLYEINEDKIKQMLTQHKKDLERLEGTLAREEKRQLENMRRNLSERMRNMETDKARKEIKMAMYRQVKEKQA